MQRQQKFSLASLCLRMEPTGILGVDKVYTPITHRPGTSSDKLQGYIVADEFLPMMWPELEQMLHRSVEYHQGTLSLKTIYEWLTNGHASAFVVTKDNRIQLVMILNIVTYSSFKAVRIAACAGKNLKESMKFIHELECWALTQGCVEIEAWCRPAMVRLVQRFGWMPRSTIVTRDLRRKLQ